MKKIFLALAAVAALASCSKSEAQYEDVKDEISFAPVAKNITKTMITGTAFPKTESFNVWAWYKQVPKNTSVDEWGATDSEHLYISEGEFVNQGGTPNWKGKTSYYWPKVGSLLFAGYYPTSIEDDVEYHFNSTTNEMVFNNIKERVVDAVDPTEDIMYFNMTSKSSNAGPVSVVFKHALSWITVNLSRPSDNAVGVEYPKILVNSVTFTKVNPQGTGTVTGTDGTIQWETNGTVQNPVVTPATGVVLTKAVQKQTEPLFIPQDLIADDPSTTDVNEAMQLQVNYTIFSSETEYFTETYSVDLAQMQGTSNGTTTVLSKWEPAKHYTYNISISLEEILIAPTVEDWTDVTVAVPVK